MDTASSTQSDRSFGYVSVTAVLIGLFVVGYGLLLVPQSLLGGAWIAAIGVAFALAGIFNTVWAGRRFGLSDGDRRTLTVTSVALAAVLTVAFVVINVW
ncbi:hypothetical protein [Halostella sp. PRR32]|uniref:hypothetical protein n=1 Tax=Halostella sp. PRR32 TaxID=3098147 RepID=UPI00110D3BF1|nr:hypothetical protein [Halostella sp. PRR32]